MLQHRRFARLSCIWEIVNVLCHVHKLQPRDLGHITLQGTHYMRSSELYSAPKAQALNVNDHLLRHVKVLSWICDVLTGSWENQDPGSDSVIVYDIFTHSPPPNWTALLPIQWNPSAS